MASAAPPMCKIAQEEVVGGSKVVPMTTPSPSPDQLLVLLEVSRSGRFTVAAGTLGLNHTTVARKIAALEKSLGGRVLVRSAGGWELTPLGERAVGVASQVADAVARLGPEAEDPVAGVVRMTATDGFSAYIASPAVAALRRTHPGLAVELVTVTRRAQQQRSGVDIEVVVGEPQVHRAEAIPLGAYTLGMYASHDYLDRHGTPECEEDFARHGLVYFVDSMLQVDDLDAPRRLAPQMRDALTSTNVFVHVEATRAGAGIGFLPCFMADRHPDLVRLLPERFSEQLPYWMVVRADALRQPAVAAVVSAIRSRMAEEREMLLGRPGPGVS
ncbi:LysR family transcriptional regulator [Arthrobacter woluwensis]|nr:LysR family transcriptional regulator [Arthrobacter woluwensis]